MKSKTPKTMTLGRHQVTETRLPGVFRILEGGGYVVRSRVTDRMTGKQIEIRKVLMNAENERAAFNWLEDEKLKVQSGQGTGQKPHFSDYATSLMERKVKTRELRSPTSIDRWKHTIKHLIFGTQSEDGELSAPGFGEVRLDELKVIHIERWRTGVAELIGRGDYSPRTANGWCSILRVILKEAAREYELPRRLNEEVKDFSTDDHPTYTEEAPQSLGIEQVWEFLSIVKANYPQFYAMTWLAFFTGLRPSSLRPLRRRGSQSDVNWDERLLLVRRSHTTQKDDEEILKTTKQRTRYRIRLAEETMAVLRWHIETQLTPVQEASELLFPSSFGGFRASGTLNKPFSEVSTMMGLPYSFTVIGCRRTYNDLAREAGVADLVTRSISGHLTEEMQHHYSTVRGHEQAHAQSKIIDLAKARGDRCGDRLQKVVIAGSESLSA